MCIARWCLLALLPAGVLAQDYADPKLCAACHPAIAATYRQNGMGRSFSAPRPEILIEDFARNNSYYHPASDTHYQMLRRGDRIFQRRYQVGRDGQETNVDEKEVDYIVGSGNHMRTYVHRNTDGTLLQLPLAWYAENGGYWAMNPGFDSADYPYALRRIGYDCMFCHNAYPQTPAGHDRLGDMPVYSAQLPQGIDCQRCHGPGQNHVKLATTPDARPEAIRGAIVNPARLNPDLQMDVCSQCHLKTTEFRLPHAVKRYDRPDFSYRPGEPLADFALAFDAAPGPARVERFETASAVTRLRESQCFQRSQGALTCTTCHNPHDVRHGSAAATLYNKVCMGCHAKTVAEMAAARRHTASGGCIDCHMRKRHTDDIVHMSVTDHLIQRSPPLDNLMPDRPEHHEDARTMYHGEVVFYETAKRPKNPTDALYLAIAQVREDANLEKGIAQLEQAIAVLKPERPEPYFELANAYRDAGQGTKAVGQYREALQRDARYIPAILELSAVFKMAGHPAEAMAAARQATEIAPADARGWDALGQAQLDGGQLVASIAALKQALTLDPESPAAHNGIGVALAESGDMEKSMAEFQEAIRIRPNYGEPHGNLANLLSWKRDYNAAEYEFDRAVRLQPADFGTRFNFAAMLNQMRRFDDAQTQIEAAIRANPNIAEAHDLLGSLLERKGAKDAAFTEYQEAVRLKPDFDHAQLDLGAMLLDRGKKAEAKEHLTVAAKSSDPNLRQMAESLLGQIR